MKSKLYILVIVSILMCLNAAAQTQEELVGIWEYRGVYGQDHLDGASSEGAARFFGDLKLTLMKDGNFEFQFMNAFNKGKWKLVDSKKIKLTSENGDVKEVEILEYSSETMGIKLSSGSFSVERAEEEDVVLETVNAYVGQIAKTWYLKKRQVPGEPLEVVNVMLNKEHPFLELKKNKTFQSLMFGVKEKGDWKLDNDNSKLVLTTKEGAHYFQLHKLSEQEMELYKGNTAEIWYFSTHE